MPAIRKDCAAQMGLAYVMSPAQTRQMARLIFECTVKLLDRTALRNWCRFIAVVVAQSPPPCRSGVTNARNGP
jgi:hypothetical protein